MSENRDEFNRSGFLAFAFSMVFVFAFFLYLVAMNKGVDLAENVIDPNAPVEEGAAPAFDIKKVVEPWVSTPELVEYGHKLYKTNCALCHGDTGMGDGAAGAGLNPKPRNLVEGKWTQGNGLTDHYKVLQNGIKGTSMAAYSHFTPADRWAMLIYIESITKNPSQEDLAKVAEFAKTAQ